MALFYHFDERQNKIIVKRAELTFVPQFEELRKLWGWNALQYLFYFSAITSPFESKKDLDVRDRNVADAIRKFPWDNTGRSLPKRFYQELVYVNAEKEFKENHEDQEELEENKVIADSRKMVMEQIKTVSARREQDIDDFKGAVNNMIKTKIETHFAKKKEIDATKLFQEIITGTDDIVNKTFSGLTPIQLKDLKMLLDQLSSLSKHQKEARNASKDRVNLDEQPSVVFGEHDL